MLAFRGFQVALVELVCLDPFLMIVYELAEPLKENLLFHFVVITELCIVPIQHLKFAVWSVWAKDLEKVVIGARPLEFCEPQLEL